ncbi:MAG TPA: histidine kinase dimerization/phosphoacceptor domain -containing protein, partial [Myxococcaceae bacterium]|nr:histidine kinase dimerization/phosphoacceptor domain -containing protein [Myxococcaceae bacterium]
MVRNSPAAIAILRGPEFRFELVNPAFAALAPGEPMIGRTVADVWSVAAPLAVPPLQNVRATRTPYHASGVGLPLHRGPGSQVEQRYFDFSFAPLEEDRILVMAIEVTHHRQVQEDLRSAHQELAAIHANAPVALFLVDEGRRGNRPGGAIGCLNALADPGGCGQSESCCDCPIRNATLDSLNNNVRHQSVEAWVPIRVDGHTESRCLLVSTAPMPFTGIKRVLVCAQDITELKTAVSQAESALAEKTVLFKELHHRVKNNLAVVSSLLRMKADAATNEEVRGALEASHRRVHSMALIHEQLYASDRLDKINFSEYAQQLVERLRHAFVDEPLRVSIETDLDPIELGIEQAVPCGLILNELLTNAFKYAFPGNNQGVIRISFHECDRGLLELAVEDNGIGLSSELLSGRA